MKSFLFVLLLALAGCNGGGGGGSAAQACASKGGQWQQITTHDAQGHTFNDYHCL